MKKTDEPAATLIIRTDDGKPAFELEYDDVEQARRTAEAVKFLSDLYRKGLMNSH